MSLWKFCVETPDGVTIRINKNLLPAAFRNLLPVEGYSWYNKWCSITVVDDQLEILVAPKYAWDGCTPKFKWGNVIVGIPDGPVILTTHKPVTYYASLIHDVFCQFQPRGFSRKAADLIFHYLLEEPFELNGRITEQDFLFSDLYFAAVRMFAVLKRCDIQWSSLGYGDKEIKVDA